MTHNADETKDTDTTPAPTPVKAKSAYLICQTCSAKFRSPIQVPEESYKNGGVIMKGNTTNCPKGHRTSADSLIFE